MAERRAFEKNRASDEQAARHNLRKQNREYTLWKRKQDKRERIAKARENQIQ